MSGKKSITIKQVRNKFNTIGAVLIIYCFAVLLIPYGLDRLFTLMNNPILDDKDLYYGVLYIVLLLGTMIPFGILRKINHIKLKDIYVGTDMTIKDICIETIIVFSLVSLTIFISTVISTNFGIGGEVVSGIGISIDPSLVNNLIYVVTFIFVSPLLEEYAFRGVLLSSLKKYGRRFALYTSAIIYALAHGSLVEMFPALVMAIFLGNITYKHKSIQPAIFIHILFNISLLGISYIPQRYSLYLSLGLLAVYLFAFFMLFFRRYQVFYVKKTNTNKDVYKIFFSCFLVIISLGMFILHSILLMFY